MSEINNALKMREALFEVDRLIRDEVKWTDEMSNRQAIALGVIQSALSAPPRNCDVGSPEEQSERMAKFCGEQYKKTNGVELCSGCRFHNIKGLDCQFAWAQMPFTKGETK